MGPQPGVDPYHTCPCGDNCKCPPKACALGLCKKQYAVVFGAEWCTYCHKMEPVINELRAKGYAILYVSLDHNPEVQDKFKVHSLPTTIIMRDGKEYRRIVGLTQARKISKHLKTLDQQGL